MIRDLEERFLLLGGIVPIGKTFVPVTEEEMKSIEADLGVSLPSDYRDLLTTYGAASFGKLVEYRTGFGKAPLSHFYGSKDGKQSLSKRINTYKGRMPDTLIPIADDGGGDQICLGIKGEEQGKIYYWDHENEWDEEDYQEEHGSEMPLEAKFQNVQPIAGSFIDFINMLEARDG
jgi:hypothetical protein